MGGCQLANSIFFHALRRFRKLCVSGHLAYEMACMPGSSAAEKATRTKSDQSLNNEHLGCRLQDRSLPFFKTAIFKHHLTQKPLKPEQKVRKTEKSGTQPRTAQTNIERHGKGAREPNHMYILSIHVCMCTHIYISIYSSCIHLFIPRHAIYEYIVAPHLGI